MRYSRLTVGLLVSTMGSSTPAQDTEVFVIGALGALHEAEDGFSFETLERIIQRIRPQVLLLEVTPEELAGRLETRGRPEYPRVIWPMLGAHDAPPAYAMEAGQPLYSQLIRDADTLWGAFGRDHPVTDSALTAYSNATTGVLLAHWSNPADTQDDVTDALARARHALRAALFPPGHIVQVRWDSVMVDAATNAIARHPGSRVLVLASHRNRFMFIEALRRRSGVKLVDMRDWLLAHGFGAD